MQTGLTTQYTSKLEHMVYLRQSTQDNNQPNIELENTVYINITSTLIRHGGQNKIWTEWHHFRTIIRRLCNHSNMIFYINMFVLPQYLLQRDADRSNTQHTSKLEHMVYLRQSIQYDNRLNIELPVNRFLKIYNNRTLILISFNCKKQCLLISHQHK